MTFLIVRNQKKHLFRKVNNVYQKQNQYEKLELHAKLLSPKRNSPKSRSSNLWNI